ncbi:zinc-ribbon domain-containing protein [Paraliomyxa miuraensis]|uniref:zinc-ribbon domain-containing protein n=1 Tax=Paraliomyxa miuraensis TaxID=376150 RepID=UPI00224E6339|nr:zinc-ribbon domain-containing protein [Paraliomyxa miuraensis]MCX4246925.1 FHA domain-containing protein [Paraliomyxa miuraensis]
MICWSCQTANPAEAKFCASCGSPLVADPETEGPCRECGAPLPLDARFCGNCGTPDPLADLAPDPAANPAPDLAPDPAPDALALPTEILDVEEEDEATMSRPQLEQVPVIATPGPKSREHLRTEPAKVASARTLAERLGRGPVAPVGVYSKQGPSLRKAEGAVGAGPGAGPGPKPSAIPPPPTTLRKAGLPARPVPGPKVDTHQKLPRQGLPERALPGPPPMPAGPRNPQGAGLGVRRAAPGEAAPSSAIRPEGVGRRPPLGRAPGAAGPSKAPLPSPSPGEAAALLAAPKGWPDLTDEIAEVRFSALQGVDTGVLAEFEALRRKHPGHPDVEALAVELGIGPGGSPAGKAPPRGRFPAAAPVESDGPSRRAGAPESAPLDTSDELLGMEPGELDELDELDEPDPGDSMTDLTLVDRFDLDIDLGSSDDVEPEDDEFVDRTLMTPSPRPTAPAPGALPGPLEPRSLVERGGTLPPGFELVDDRRSTTLAPGTDHLDDDERSTTLPPGGYVIEREEPTLAGVSFDADRASTLAGLAYDHEDPPTLGGGMTFDLEEPTLTDIDASALSSFGAEEPYDGAGGEPSPEPGMLVPDRDAAEAAEVSGTFNVADLGLDDMPDLSMGLPPEDVDAPGQATNESTVVSRNPVPPAPYGQTAAPVPVLPVLLVMLGPRGEAVAEVRIEPNTYLDVGRQPGTPWAEDRRMQPLHARLFPGPGGIVVDDFGQPYGVYSQIFDTIAVDDGDEFKVGQARLALQRFNGADGSWGQLTLARHDSSVPESVVLTSNEIILGREEGDVVFPTDTFVSGDHCRFVREGHAVYLEDLGSSNGTYVRVRAGQCVAFGGLVLIGHTQFEVHPG